MSLIYPTPPGKVPPGSRRTSQKCGYTQEEGTAEPRTGALNKTGCPVVVRTIHGRIVRTVKPQVDGWDTLLRTRPNYLLLGDPPLS